MTDFQKPLTRRGGVAPRLAPGTPRRVIAVTRLARLSHGLPTGPGAPPRRPTCGGAEYTTPHLAARASLGRRVGGIAKWPTASTAAPPRNLRQGH